MRGLDYSNNFNIWIRSSNSLKVFTTRDLKNEINQTGTRFFEVKSEDQGGTCDLNDVFPRETFPPQVHDHSGPGYK